MTLEKLKEIIDGMYEIYGDVEVRSFLNHNHAPSVFYDEDNDCVYVNN